MKRKYEIVYIFDSALEEPEVNEHLDRFHELLKSPEQPEPITSITHWGKRTLAYPIKRKEMGYYVVVHFETDTKLLSEFERVTKSHEAVLRYLVVINEGLSAAQIHPTDSGKSLAEIKESAEAPGESAGTPPGGETPTQATDETSEAETEEEPAASTDEGGK